MSNLETGSQNSTANIEENEQAEISRNVLKENREDGMDTSEAPALIDPSIHNSDNLQPADISDIQDIALNDVGLLCANSTEANETNQGLLLDLNSDTSSKEKLNKLEEDSKNVSSSPADVTTDATCAADFSRGPDLIATSGSDVMQNQDGGATAAASSLGADAPQQSVYHVKWIKFKGDQVAIITQNENGPCPLLAIMNCLLLQAKVKLPGMMEIITSGQLMEYLGDCIFENAPKNLGEESLLNYEQNMSDAMAVFDKLQTGLDVNVRFTGVRDFEYTRECIVFDLLNIQLYHGWLADPQNRNEISAVGQCSYNQLVEKIIEQKNSENEREVTEALVAEDFLNRSCHQLTYHGLSELCSQVKEAELSVFFRNNHFSTLLKHKNELFTLVTDQGFLTESNVVWETLSNVEGDGHFVDAEFRTYRKPEPSSEQIPPSSVPVGSDQQIDQDYLVALSLQEETGATVPARETSTVPAYNQGSVPLTDHELAMKLQEEEDRQASVMLQQQQQQQQQQQRQPSQQPDSRMSSRERESRERKKSGDCTLL